MSGYDLKEGILKDNTKTNFFSVISHSLLSTKHKTMTYKYCFLKCILDNLFLCNKDYKISFPTLNLTFSTIYWNSIVLYNIPVPNNKNINAKSSIELAYDKIIKDYPYANNIEFDSLKDDIKRIVTQRTYTIFKKYVIGALYSEMNGLLYGFSKKGEYIYLNKNSYNFLINNKVLLDQLNYYEWLKLVESILKRRNSKIDNLSTKLEDITKRTNLDFFKQELDKLGSEETCFYCGKKIQNLELSLDHVVPFDFIRKDELWNLVFCHKSCNSSKNNRVPKEIFIKKLIERNTKLNIESPDIRNIYKIALQNGIDIWDKY